MALYRSKSKLLIAMSGLLDQSPGADAVFDQDEYYAAKDEYYAAKSGDTSLYKWFKSYTLWLRFTVLAAMCSNKCMQTALLLGFMLLTGIWTWSIQSQGLVQHHTQHLVVLDAGSTGTRVHVFRYIPAKPGAYAQIHLPEAKLKVEPGLSSYADNPAAGAASLMDLLEFAYRHVPLDERQQTPVQLMATAGLRLLSPNQQADLLEHCRQQLAGSQFFFRREWVQIISGQQEGLYAWAAANYAAGILQEAAQHLKHRKEPRDQWHGLLELGGASAQVTVLADSSSSASSIFGGDGSKGRGASFTPVDLPGVTKNLFSHSFLGYGFDVIEQRVQAIAAAANSSNSSSSLRHDTDWRDPCLPLEYVDEASGHVGAGDWKACRQLVSRVMNPALCRVHAPAATDCPELPPQVPKLRGPLLAIENFFWTAHALQLPAKASTVELEDAATAFCAMPWHKTLARPHNDPEQQRFLWRYCYGAAVVWTLLHDVLKIPPGLQLHFTNTLKRQDGTEVGLDWALGAAVMQLSNQDARVQRRAHWFVRQLVLVVGLMGMIGAMVLVARQLGLARRGIDASYPAAGLKGLGDGRQQHMVAGLDT